MTVLLKLLVIFGGGTGSSPHNFPIRHGPVVRLPRMLFAVFLYSTANTGIHDRLPNKRLSEIIVGFLGGIRVAHTRPVPLTLAVAIADAGRRHVFTTNRWNWFNRLNSAGLSEEWAGACR
jgi:hypothetical protein